MSEEMKQETAQESQETMANDNKESGSEPNYKQEMMKYKSQRNEEREENASLKAEKEERRTKKLEEDGKYKELIAELKSTNEKQAVRIEKADKLELQLKVDIINSITSEDAKREELATKDIETLRFIQNEIGNNTVNNPQESLGSVRKANSAYKDFTKLTDQEKRDNWPEIVASMKQ